MSERVIAIDPGERAGWASATLAENSITDIEHGVLPCKQMATILAHQQAVDDHIVGPDFDVIVYETWRPRPKAGSLNWIQGNQLLSAQLVGQIRLVGWLSGAKLRGYGPDRKGPFQAFIDSAPWGADIKQRQADCLEQHDQDALMHLAGYFAENWWTQ